MSLNALNKSQIVTIHALTAVSIPSEFRYFRFKEHNALTIVMLT